MSEREERRQLAAKRSRDRRGDSDVPVELYSAVVWGLEVPGLSPPVTVRRVGGATVFDWNDTPDKWPSTS